MGKLLVENKKFYDFIHFKLIKNNITKYTKNVYKKPYNI